MLLDLSKKDLPRSVIVRRFKNLNRQKGSGVQQKKRPTNREGQWASIAKIFLTSRVSQEQWIV
jgi:hypothetical protein